MPEIKNTFTSGKMNKDLDERLVPKGEYRDALNIDISTSETSDVGAIENSLGNTLKSGTFINNGSYIADATCVGSIVNKEKGTIVWFINGSNIDAIVEYDPETEVADPILVDNFTDSSKGNQVKFLNFSSTNIITGINIIGEMLFWTDGENEPKKINMGVMKKGIDSADPWRKTNILVKEGNGIISKGDDDTNNYVEEKHITIIKRAPFSAPKIALSSTERISEGVDEASINVPENTTHTSTPIDAGVGNGSYDNIYSSSSGSVLIFNDDVPLDTNRVTLTTGDAFPNVIFVDPNQSGLSWKQWIGCDSTRHVKHIDSNSYVRRYEIDETHSTGGIDHKTGRIYLKCDAVASNIAVGDRIVLSHHLVEFNNESFWTYKDDSGKVLTKPAGTNNHGKLENDGTYLKDGGFLNDGSGVDFTPRFDEDDIILSSPDSGIPAPSGNAQQTTSQTSGWHKLAPVANLSGSTPGWNDMYADSSDSFIIYDSTNAADILVGMVVTSAVTDVVQPNTRITKISGSSPQTITLDKPVTDNFSTDSSSKTRVTFIAPNGLLMQAGSVALDDKDQFLFRAIPENTSTRDGLIPGHFYRVTMDINVTANGGEGFPTEVSIRNSFGVGKDLRATFTTAATKSVSGVFQYDPHGEFNVYSPMGGSWDTPSGAGLIFVKDIDTVGTIKNINITCISKPRPVKIQEISFLGKPDYVVGDTVKLTLANNPLDDEDEVQVKVSLTKENQDTSSVTEFPTYALATTVGSELLHSDAAAFTDASKWTIGSSGWTINTGSGGSATSAASAAGTLDATTSNGGLTGSLTAGAWYKFEYVVSASSNTGLYALQLNAQTFDLSDHDTNATLNLLSNTATHTIYFRQGSENLTRLRLYLGTDPDITLTSVSLKAVTMTGQVDFKTTGSNQSRKTFECEIVSIDKSVTQLLPSQARRWDAVRVQKESIHQENFARFAYRWKYQDNQYSAFSPFTKVAFLPSSEYDYDTEEGFNKSMINDVRRITLSDFDPAPEDVVEVDILYKASNSNSVYNLKTIKAGDTPYSMNSLSSLADDPLEVSITSEMVHAVLPENQLLRQYDNVPITARAQEVTANRLLYGNYKQQYDLVEEPVIKSIVTSNEVEQGQLPKESIKSLRKYQVGVALLDEYGRTTPVFSNDNLNVLNLGQDLAKKSNTIKAKVTSLPPNFATHYKFYVKDPSAEYYNLPMDRFYPAEESDQVWISFASTDINKVKEEDYIILKKSHDGNDDFAPSGGKVFRYKVLSLETSPPDWVANEKKLITSASSCNFTTSSNNNSTGYPLKNRVIVRVNAVKFSNNQTALDLLPEQVVGTIEKSPNTWIRIFSNKQGTASNFYEVDSIEYGLANSQNYYEFKLVGSLGDDVDFTGPAPGSSSRLLDLEIWKSNPNDYKAEFNGRFFVKIMKDLEFNRHILKTYASPTKEYGVIASQDFFWLHHYISGENEFGYESDDLDHQRNTYNFSESEQTLHLDSNIIGATSGIIFGPTELQRSAADAIDATNNTVTYPKSNQLWVIDSAFGWHQKSREDLGSSRNEHTNQDGNMGQHMGCGFLLGNRHADFRVVCIGDGTEPGDDQDEGYKFDRKASVFKQFFDNWPIYKRLSKSGTKFRWQNDPTNTIYTITASEILDINNYTNDGDDDDFHQRSNQGIRLHIEFDKPIAWTPTNPTAEIGEQAFGLDANGDEITSSSSGDGYIAPLNNDTSPTGTYILSNSSKLEILQDLPNEDTFASDSPAIFEVEPKERVDLNLYYETSQAILIPKTGMKITTDYIDESTNASALLSTATITCDARFPEQFVINHGTHSKTTGAYSSVKQTCDIPAGETFKIHKLDNNGNIAHSRSFTLPFNLVVPGSVYSQTTRSGGTTSGPITSLNQTIVLPLHNLEYYNCFSFGNGVESNRIRDDFNAATIDKGARVSSVLKAPYRQEHKQNGIIYSGLYNYDSGVNRLNEFNQAEKITKFVNPDYGSIQKLFTRNTNVVAFCENKILKILANKDALFNADGNTNLTSTNNVLGQTIPFAGEYGIAKNPESFANFGYRIYFTDKNRSAILRLSGDGLTDISVYGMDNWFKDNLKPSSTIVGSYDEDKDNYNLTLNNYTVSFNENVNGWNSFKSFIPESGLSLKGYYYTFKNGNLYLHNLNENRNQFYGTEYNSTIKFLLNENPSDIKIFKTLNYEGSASQAYTSTTVTTEGWYASTITTDKQSAEVLEFTEKEGKWFSYIKGVDTDATNIDLKELAVQGLGVAASVGSAPSPVYRLIRITVTSTEADAAVPVKWRITNSVTDSSTTASKEVDLFIAANTATSTDHDFYIHGLNVNGQSYTVDTLNGGWACSGGNTLTFADGYNNNGTWAASTAHRGLTTNIVRLRVTQSTSNPDSDVKQTRNVTGTAYLKQN